MIEDILMRNADIVEQIRRKSECLLEVLDERGRRVWAAVEAEGLGTEHRCQRHESVTHHPPCIEVIKNLLFKIKLLKLS